MFGIIFLIIEIIIVLVGLYIGIKIFLWLFDNTNCFIHHLRFPDRQKLKRGALKGYLVVNYGKKHGKSIYNEIRQALKKKGIK